MSRFLNVTRWFKRQLPEPVMSSAEMRRELQHCTAALAEARGRLDLDGLTPYDLAQARLDLLQIQRRLDTVRDRLDEVEGPQYSDDDLITLGRIQERARVMNERVPERGGRQ